MPLTTGGFQLSTLPSYNALPGSDFVPDPNATMKGFSSGLSAVNQAVTQPLQQQALAQQNQQRTLELQRAAAVLGPQIQAQISQAQLANQQNLADMDTVHAHADANLAAAKLQKAQANLASEQLSDQSDALGQVRNQIAGAGTGIALATGAAGAPPAPTPQGPPAGALAIPTGQPGAAPAVNPSLQIPTSGFAPGTFGSAPTGTGAPSAQPLNIPVGGASPAAAAPLNISSGTGTAAATANVGQAGSLPPAVAASPQGQQNIMQGVVQMYKNNGIPVTPQEALGTAQAIMSFQVSPASQAEYQNKLADTFNKIAEANKNNALGQFAQARAAEQTRLSRTIDKNGGVAQTYRMLANRGISPASVENTPEEIAERKQEDLQNFGVVGNDETYLFNADKLAAIQSKAPAIGDTLDDGSVYRGQKNPDGSPRYDKPPAANPLDAKIAELTGAPTPPADQGAPGPSKATANPSDTPDADAYNAKLRNLFK